MRLIDYDALYQELLISKPAWIWANYDVDDVIKQVLDIVKAQPTIDAVKHGHWIYDGSTSTGDYFKCSECNAHIFLDESWKVSFKHVSDRKRYCHNCGAKMDGDDNAID